MFNQIFWLGSRFLALLMTSATSFVTSKWLVFRIYVIRQLLSISVQSSIIFQMIWIASIFLLIYVSCKSNEPVGRIEFPCVKGQCCFIHYIFDQMSWLFKIVLRYSVSHFHDTILKRWCFFKSKFHVHLKKIHVTIVEILNLWLD